MAGFRRHVTIDRPRAEVWAFLTDLARAGSWVPGLVSVEPVGGSALGVGTRLRETRRLHGKEAVAEVEVTAWEPPIVYALGSEYGGAMFEYRYELTSPTETSTTVELIASGRADGARGKLACIPMLQMMQETDGDQLERLRGAIEAARVAV